MVANNGILKVLRQVVLAPILRHRRTAGYHLNVGLLLIYGNSYVRFSHHVFITDRRRLIMFIEIIAIYLEVHKQRINTLYWQNREVRIAENDEY
jgi:hypothetical protein